MKEPVTLGTFKNPRLQLQKKVKTNLKTHEIMMSTGQQMLMIDSDLTHET